MRTNTSVHIFLNDNTYRHTCKVSNNPQKIHIMFWHIMVFSYLCIIIRLREAEMPLIVILKDGCGWVS